MISLTSRQRSLVLFFSASAYIAWFSGVDERSEAQGIGGTPTPSLTIAPRSTPPRVTSVIRRDPFAGNPGETESGAAAAVPASGGNASDQRAPEPGSAMPLVGGGVPDIGGAAASGSDRTANDAPLTLVVRATITGPNPVAYVANGTMMDIVRVDDRLGDRRVAKIDLRGIAFADGSRLDLPGNFDPTPAPRVGPGGVTIRLDDLRKLLAGSGGVAPPLAPPAGANPATVTTPTPAPSSTPTGNFPMPGPLPTVNQRGIPVGTNPTFDPTAPTPYPEPYPYAPPRRP